MNMKSINTRIKFKTNDNSSISKNVMTNIICRIITFCSTLVHYFTLKNRLNILKFVNVEIFLNRAFKQFKSKKSRVVIFMFFRFRDIDIFVFKKTLSHYITCIVMFFNNWWKVFIIMISWMFIKSCFQT
jgi:hypothetical protein